MIWFACKQCGKVQGRPDSAAGSLIFCNCGSGNTVPWESTVEPPPESVPTQNVPPLPPILEPIPIEESNIPPVVPARPARPSYPQKPRREYDDDDDSDYPDYGRRSRSDRDYPPRSRRYSFQPKIRDREHCFNHQQIAISKTCEDCEEGFCDSCVTSWNGKFLCGPCKNRRIRLQSRSPRTSILAMISLWLGLVCGPATMCLLPLLSQSRDALPFLVLAILAQAVTIGLAITAFLINRHRERVTGMSFAVSGLILASFGLFLSITGSLFSFAN